MLNFKGKSKIVSLVLLVVMLMTPIAGMVEASSGKGTFEIFHNKVNYNLGEDLSTVKYGVDDFDESLLEGNITKSDLNKVYKEYNRIAAQVKKSNNKSELDEIYTKKMNNIVGPNLKQVGSFRYLDPLNSLKYTIYGSLRDTADGINKDLTGTFFTRSYALGEFKGFTDPSKYGEYEEYFKETIKAIESEVEFKSERPFAVLVPIEETSFGGGAYVVNGLRGSEMYVNCVGSKADFVHAVAHEVGHILPTEFASDKGVLRKSKVSLRGISGELDLLGESAAVVEKNFIESFNAHKSTKGEGVPLTSKALANDPRDAIHGYGHRTGQWADLAREHVAESISVYFTDKITGKSNNVYTNYTKNNEATREFIQSRGYVNGDVAVNKPQAKPEVKPEEKPDEKPEKKPEVKPEVKPDEKEDVKEDEKEGNNENVNDLVDKVDLGEYFKAAGLNVGLKTGYIQGYGNEFRPFNTITRAELAQMLNNIYKDEVLNRVDLTRMDFMNDVKPRNWYYTPVMRMSKLGVINGYPGGYFRANNAVTRVEFATVLYNLAGDGVKNVDTRGIYLNDKVSWGEDQLKVAVAQGWLDLDNRGNIRPNDTLTRIEVISVLNDILEIEDRGDVKIRFKDLVGLSEEVYNDIYKSVLAK